jgi:mRNA interferase MazF
VNRGELWTVSGGVYAAKPRPAIIVQDDLFAATESVVVIPLTATTVAGAAVARIAIPSDPLSTGIAQPSFAMIDKITTVRRSNLGTRIGRVSTTLMADIERSLMVFLGLAS